MDRGEKFALLSGSFDVLIVGGGATGLGIAVDAATRGYKTALVEAGDFAQATSSRATKLAHGGIRYLASGQLHLVYEALRERTVMIRNAPHLVKPLPFIMPARHWLELPYYAIGLKLYDILSGRSSLGSTRILGRRKTEELIPGIETSRLKGSILYLDGQFDDARLALALARTAEDHGAIVLNYVRSQSFLYADGKLAGIIARDVETGIEIEVHAKVVINATGIFVDELRAQDNPYAPKLLSVSRGTHIVVGPHVLGGSHAIIVPKTDDGRVIFAIPWFEKVIIGTTEMPAREPAMEPEYESSEIDYLLDHINPYLAVPIVKQDILSIFSGLRPLIAGKGAKTSKLSREHHIEGSASGLITISGGKWTTYRRMAEDVIDFAIRERKLAKKPCRTRDVRLHGAPGNRLDSNNGFTRYGTDARRILDLIDEETLLDEKIDSDLPYTFAEVVYAVRYEMARTLEDVLSRRTRALILNAEAARRAAPLVANIMARELKAPPEWEYEQVVLLEELATKYYLLKPLRRGVPQRLQNMRSAPI